ncbi:MAG: T9SS type A sorting domain-containing protein [Saprospiraceae bacterium]|nr:T9SS type A sorting domain-containing protein [Saprospiraceae bacterium]
MKLFATVILFLKLTSEIELHGQQILDQNAYFPVNLQNYSPPKDTANQANSLIAYNILKNKFDTIHFLNKSIYSSKKFSSLRSEEKIDSKIDSNKVSYVFSTVKPADQLGEFPNYPISTVVKLFITFYNPTNGSNSFGTCSGVMISPEFVLTAGHCIKSKFDSSYAVSCIVIPAYNLGKQPYGRVTIKNWFSFTQWLSNGDLDYDIAIMSLNQPIGNSTGWLDLSYNTDSNFYYSGNNVFNSFGYPAYDPTYNPVFEMGERMYYMNGYMDFSRSTNLICHNNIAYQGQSGSGVFLTDSINNPKVFAVLSNGSVFPPYHTCHCRLDSSMYVVFNNIISKSNSIDNNIIKNQIVFYPNPVKNVVNILFHEMNSSDANLEIIDMFGKTIIKETINEYQSSAKIDLTSIPPGPYIVKIGNNTQRFATRIIKID